MRLVHSEYNLDLELKENRVNVVSVENQAILAEIIQELCRQCNGGEGQFVFSDRDKILPMNKHIKLITDVFSLDCNEKKILTRLYQELEQLAIEDMAYEGIRLNSEILFYVENLCEKTSYHLKYQPEFSPSQILKLMDLEFETEAVSMLEKIIEYLGISNQLFKSTVTIFVNLKLFLTEKEMENLYEYAFYNKISLVLLEGTVRRKLLKEDLTIIDMDRCVIKV